MKNFPLKGSAFLLKKIVLCACESFEIPKDYTVVVKRCTYTTMYYYTLDVIHE